MSLVTAHNLAIAYGAQDVFAGVRFEIPHQARIALIGPNGSGKTSLLRLIAGLEQPTEGQIARARGLAIGYLPQDPDLTGQRTLFEEMRAVFASLEAQAAELRRLEKAMADPATRDEALARYGPLLEAFEAAGGYTYEHRIRRVLAGLGFTDADLHRPLDQFSGGQKTRVLLARLLLQDPDLLLLDEPTNHLDVAAMEWLEGYLNDWPGALVVVAHDRAFLDAVAHQVWELFDGRLEVYPGNYSRYRTLRAERIARRRAEYERQQAFIAKTEEFIRRHIAGQRTKEAQGRRKRLERMVRLEKPRDYRPPRLTLKSAGRSGNLVLGFYHLTVGYDPARPLFTCDEVELRWRQRVALIGPNGSGKTTLLRTILGQVPPLAGRVRIGASVRIGYFAQAHEGLEPSRTVLDHVLEAGDLTVSQARHLLGRYHFSGDAVFKRVGDLSGGERTRVALALLALQGANLLLLDEPTNHLDIPSQEVLQAVLEGFEGTLLLVTHDRYLIQALGGQVWAIEDGRLWVFEEGYAQYRAWQAARRSDGGSEKRAPSSARRDGARRAARQAEREARRRAERQAELENLIAHLEAQLADLSGDLERAGQAGDVERVRRLGADYARLEAELEARLAEWAEVADG